LSSFEENNPPTLPLRRGRERVGVDKKGAFRSGISSGD
jgi:hypothetical protein